MTLEWSWSLLGLLAHYQAYDPSLNGLQASVLEWVGHTVPTRFAGQQRGCADITGTGPAGVGCTVFNKVCAGPPWERTYHPAILGLKAPQSSWMERLGVGKVCAGLLEETCSTGTEIGCAGGGRSTKAWGGGGPGYKQVR